MLLVRVVLADSEYPVGRMWGCRRPSLRPGMEEVGVTYSSVLAVPGRANDGSQDHVEAVVFAGSQCYPEYLIELAWK